MVFITLFDFHCTRLMIKFIELNNDNTLTKIQYFFILKTIFLLLFFLFLFDTNSLSFQREK